MSKTPLQKILDRAMQRVADDLQFIHDDMGFTQSPIEKILLAALVADVRYGRFHRIHSFDDVMVRGDCDDEFWLKNPPGRVYLFIECQASILTYFADFLVHTPNGKLVVECDGHNFHERTKEQAAHDRARDRAMQEAGYQVFRFTGSEIYRDPCKCAEQIVVWADKATFA